MRYATDRKFGGQRASVGRTVVVVRGGRPGGGLKSDLRSTPATLKAAMITAIIEDGPWADTPMIAVVGEVPPDVGSPGAATTAEKGGIPFVECQTEASLYEADAPLPFWTWPPRV